MKKMFLKKKLKLDHQSMVKTTAMGHYRGTSLARNRTPLGLCRRPMPGVLGGSHGGGRFLMGDVPMFGKPPPRCSPQDSCSVRKYLISADRFSATVYCLSYVDQSWFCLLITFDLKLFFRVVWQGTSSSVVYSGVTLNVARPDMNNYATLGVMLY